MNERIKELRKTLKESQDSFANKLNLSRNFVWMIEKGDREPSDRTIKDICRIYNVSEEWLRSGAGEMFVPKTIEEEIADVVEMLYKDETDPYIKALLNVVSRMSPEKAKLVHDTAVELVEEQKKIMSMYDKKEENT